MADTVSSHLHVQLSEAPPPVLLLGPPPEGLLQLVDPAQELLPLRLEDMAVGQPTSRSLACSSRNFLSCFSCISIAST